MISASKKGDYMNGKYFNSKAFEDLFSVISNKGDQDDLAALQSAMESFIDYVKEVGYCELNTKIAYATMGYSETRERQEYVQSLDTTRHSHHEAAIANCRLMNRLCAMYSIDKMFTGNEQDRLEIAEFCMEATAYFFLNRKK